MQDNAITIVENFDFETPKTKQFVEMAKNLNVMGKKVLVVLPEVENNVYLSLRNVPNASVITAKDINTYAIMHSNAILLTEGGLEVINNI